ncbi:hypothetical protein K435DRAFT_800996 [Dendrothele bispora CBS 962.96]|uniref:Uncharacterized protein n=1 Tax=Dendrothele bispora (strain CBS 962.96) TaxID=1314807 RepID=A0A4V6T5A9_DENBC|nr:hypothetical protein K435DRAFT_800996 [Dendrothele bispora CBS 962.96]
MSFLFATVQVSLVAQPHLVVFDYPVVPSSSDLFESSYQAKLTFPIPVATRCHHSQWLPPGVTLYRIEFTPAFYGAGMLSGLNASWIFFGGSILAYGIVAPSLVKNGLPFGKTDSDNTPSPCY